VGTDVADLVDQLDLADCRLSFAEQEQLSPPALEAVILAKGCLERIRRGMG